MDRQPIASMLPSKYSSWHPAGGPPLLTGRTAGSAGPRLHKIHWVAWLAMFLLIGLTLADLTASPREAVLVVPETLVIRSLMCMVPGLPKLDSISDVLAPQVALKWPLSTPGPLSVQVYPVTPGARGAVNSATCPASTGPCGIVKSGGAAVPAGTAACASAGTLVAASSNGAMASARRHRRSGDDLWGDVSASAIFPPIVCWLLPQPDRRSAGSGSAR